MGLAPTGRWWWPMSDLLAHLYRDLHEAELTAAECRADDDFLPAVIAEERVAYLERQIAALESELEGVPA